MPVTENWKTYRQIHNAHRKGVSFDDIALEYDDTPENVEDFWYIRI